MKYVAIDLETTGLDTENDQVLEFCAIIEDTDAPDIAVSDLPTFHCFVDNGEIHGNAYALMMNARAIKAIALKEGNVFREEEVIDEFIDFLFGNGYQYDGKGIKFTAAGFDSRFIERMTGYHRLIIHHRTMDPAPLFVRPSDKVMPDLSTCLARAGLPNDVKHEAASDAIAVIELFRHHFSHGV